VRVLPSRIPPTNIPRFPGTWQSPPHAVQAAVHDALEAGYRHIDCAFVYGNEAEVGAGIASFLASHPTVTRADLFVTTKLWSTWHSCAPDALDESLRRLALDYVDLYLMHWPVPLNPHGNHPNMPTNADGNRDLDDGWNYIKTWKQMEALARSGKAKAVGVSNFSVEYLKELLKFAEIVPAVDQVESHPLLPGNDLLRFCGEKGIVVAAYSPLGSTGGPLLEDETVAEVARKKGCKAGNVLLNYHGLFYIFPLLPSPVRFQSIRSGG
jgi:glycerol 2-dehydrogenase (NADP+)